MYVSFQTPGLIDLENAFTFGMSAKEGDKPIGFFGTGLKYAVSTLLRTGHKIRIYVGLKEVLLTLQEKEHRGKIFLVVCLDGVPLGFTTELGKLWKTWMAFRELHSNTIDEGGVTCGAYRPALPLLDYTTIIIEGEDFHQQFLNLGYIFMSGTTVGSTDGLNIFEGSTSSVFYRGIKAGETQRPCAFTYSITESMALTEDRTFQGSWHVDHIIKKNIVKLHDKVLIARILTYSPESYEYKLDFTDVEDYCSQSFVEVCQALYRDAFCNPSAKKIALSKGWVSPADEHVLTSVEAIQLSNATQFLENLGFNVTRYPIKVQDLGEILGTAKHGTIFMSPKCFRLGTKKVAHCIYEEFIHLSEGVQDESRDMQTFLFETIITMGERILGQPI